MSWRAVLREPLLHFLLIGLALFILYEQISPGRSDSRRIVVSQVQVDAMVRDFKESKNRLPTTSEMDGLIESHVRDEIIYREGLSLGLDRDDAVIKRRIRQKYDLIAEEQHRAAPTDDVLLAYMKAHPDRFSRSAVVSFDQIYFDPTTSNPQRLFAAKAALADRGDPPAYGDPSMLPGKVTDSSMELVANDFGDNFARQVATVPIGQWVGPLASSFGVHLVRVTSRSVPSLPSLNEARAEVLREWENDRRTRSRDENYRKLRSGYYVVMKGAVPPATTP